MKRVMSVAIVFASLTVLVQDAVTDKRSTLRELSSPDEAMLRAVIQGDVAAVRRLARMGANVNWRRRYRPGYLHIAATRDDMRLGECLVSLGAYVDMPTTNGERPLHMAIYSARFVSFLLEKGAHPNCVTSCGQTPLHKAAKHGRADTTILLLRGGADISSRSDSPPDWTSLHFAARCGEEKVVQSLLDWGADVNAESGRGRTPLSLTRHTEVAELLVQNGADVNAKDANGLTPLDHADSPALKELLRKHGGKSGKEIK